MNAEGNPYNPGAVVDLLEEAYTSISGDGVSAEDMNAVMRVYPAIIGDEDVRSGIRESEVFRADYADPIEIYYDLALDRQENVPDGITRREDFMDVWEARSYGRHSDVPEYVERTTDLLEQFYGEPIDEVERSLDARLLNSFGEDELDGAVLDAGGELGYREGYDLVDELEEGLGRRDAGNPPYTFAAPADFFTDYTFDEARFTPWKEVALVTAGIDTVQQTPEMRSVLGQLRTPVSRWLAGFYVGGKAAQEAKGA